MSSYQKMRVLSEDEYQRLQERKIKNYDPRLRSAAFLQSEIDQILNNSELSSEDRLRIFQIAQNRLIGLQHRSDKPSSTSTNSKAIVDSSVIRRNPIPNEVRFEIDENVQLPDGNFANGNSKGATLLGLNEPAKIVETGDIAQTTTSSTGIRKGELQLSRATMASFVGPKGDDTEEEDNDDFYEATTPSCNNKIQKMANETFEHLSELLPSLVPTSRLEKAQNLLHVIKKDANFSLGPHYSLVYKNSPVANSQLTDTFRSLYQTSGLSSEELARLGSTIDVFKKVGIPHSIISKQVVTRELKNPSKRLNPNPTGKGRARKIKVLHVY